MLLSYYVLGNLGHRTKYNIIKSQQGEPCSSRAWVIVKNITDHPTHIYYYIITLHYTNSYVSILRIHNMNRVNTLLWTR